MISRLWCRVLVVGRRAGVVFVPLGIVLHGLGVVKPWILASSKCLGFTGTHSHWTVRDGLQLFACGLCWTKEMRGEG